MKIDRPISHIPDSVTEKTETTLKAPGSVVEETAKEPVQIQRPLPKTDSVEIKQSSPYLDKIATAPKLDPSQTNLANQIPGALIPGVPFREKVELPKTLPNGSSVDSGVASGDLGLGKTRPGPNHMGIDLKAGGTDIRNQLNDALNLKQGGGSQSGGIQITGLGKFNLGKDWSQLSGLTTTSWGNEKKGGSETRGTLNGVSVVSTDTHSTDANGGYHYSIHEVQTEKSGKSTVTDVVGHGGADSDQPTSDKFTRFFDENGKLTGAEHTYNESDGLRTDYLEPTSDPDVFALKSYSVAKMEDNLLVERKYGADGTYQGKTVTSNDGTATEYDKDGNVKYDNPDADTITPPTPEEAKRIMDVRFSSNKTPVPSGVDEGGGPIIVDAGKDYNPLHKPFVTDPVDGQLEQTVIPNLGSVDVMNNVEGPETVNPNDPDAPPPKP